MAKILCIDDSDSIRSQLRELFQSNGFTVVEAADGFKGIDAVKSHADINLILCDVNMPEMDGITMCEKLKTQELARNIPIVIITTETNADMKAKGKAAGVIGWISKPFNSEKLLATAQKLISTGAQKESLAA